MAAIDIQQRDDLAFPRSLPEFQQLFPDDAACAAYLGRARWPNGFVCPHCGLIAEPFRIVTRPGVLECRACRRQAGLLVGTAMERSHTPWCGRTRTASVVGRKSMWRLMRRGSVEGRAAKAGASTTKRWWPPLSRFATGSPACHARLADRHRRLERLCQLAQAGLRPPCNCRKRRPRNCRTVHADDPPRLLQFEDLAQRHPPRREREASPSLPQ